MEITNELLHLLQQDVYTDAPEYAKRVKRIKALIAKLEAECTRCGMPRKHYLHTPASQCNGCKAPQDHHEFKI